MGQEWGLPFSVPVPAVAEPRVGDSVYLYLRILSGPCASTPHADPEVSGLAKTTLEERRPLTLVPLAHQEWPSPCTIAGWCCEARQAATEGLEPLPSGVVVQSRLSQADFGRGCPFRVGGDQDKKNGTMLPFVSRSGAVTREVTLRNVMFFSAFMWNYMCRRTSQRFKDKRLLVLLVVLCLIVDIPRLSSEFSRDLLLHLVFLNFLFTACLLGVSGLSQKQ